MSLHIDTAAPLRPARRLGELVEAIRSAPLGTQESHWLEWKSTLDLTTPEGLFHVARTLIAFANRLPTHAVRACDGEAYLVVGAEPGNLRGVGVIDSAKLQDGLERFVDGPFWEVDYVLVGTLHVAVFTVAAPRPGDRIHSLIRDFDRFRSGTPFIRRVGRSAPVTHRELGALQDRLLQSPLESPESPDDKFAAALGAGNPVLVNTLVRGAVNAVQTARADPAQFPPDFGSRASVEQLVELVATADRYQQITAPLLSRVIAGCSWANPEHERIWADAIATLATPAPLSESVSSHVSMPGGGQALIMGGRSEQLEALSLLPATLVLYVGAIAALQGRNYGALRALTTDREVAVSVVRPNRRSPVIEKVAPWETLARDDHSALALRIAQLVPDGAARAERLAQVTRNQLVKPTYVCSIYLHSALRNQFTDYSDTEYDELFDEAEVMLSLIMADLVTQRSNPFTEPWLGLFVKEAAECADMKDSRCGRILTTARAAGSQWPALQARLFGGSAERFERAAEWVWQTTNERRFRARLR